MSLFTISLIFPGDTLQIYGNPLSGDEVGNLELEDITEHNFPDDPDADGADLNNAFTTFKEALAMTTC